MLQVASLLAHRRQRRRGHEALPRGRVRSRGQSAGVAATSRSDGGRSRSRTLKLACRRRCGPWSTARARPAGRGIDGLRRLRQDRHRPESGAGESEENPRRRACLVRRLCAGLGSRRFAVAVLVEHGGHGGETAAPVARVLLEAALESEGDRAARGRGDAEAIAAVGTRRSSTRGPRAAP